MVSMPDDERLVRRFAFLPKQIAEGGERPAVGKTQALRIRRTPIDGKAVEVSVVVGVVVEMCL